MADPANPGLLQISNWLTRTFGALVAIDIVMALAFEQSMQVGSGTAAYGALGMGDVLATFDTSLPHLKQWQIVTIGGFSAYQFFMRNDELIPNLWQGNHVTVSMLPSFYTIGQLTFLLTALQRLRKRFTRPDSPTDAGTR